jgi:hypothetical protein
MYGYRVPGLFLILFLLFSHGGVISYGDDSPRSGPELLSDKYHEVEKELVHATDPVFFYVESAENKNSSHVDVYGTINYPFDIVQHELLIPTNWCQIVLPHPDVRACTYGKTNNTWLLNIYNVNKSSEPIETAYQMKFVYHVSKLQPAYFNIGLTAREGPSHTRDHQIRLEAIPLERNKTFIHLRYSVDYNAMGYFIMKLFGGTKIGFSIIGTDKAGHPVYVEELRGAVERDVVCHYLAILAYLNTREAPSDKRYERRISQWYDLSDHFKKQLFEMKRDEYLKYKNQDWEHQQSLQDNLDRQEICNGVKTCLRSVTP